MNLMIFPLLLTSFGPVDAWDVGILGWVQEHLANPFFDRVMPVLSFLADKGWFMIVCAVVLMLFPKTRKMGFTMGLALAMGLLLVNGMLKPLVARTRPYVLYKELYDSGALRLLVHTETDGSFPSGHTLASFEAACGVFLWNKKWGAGALVLAFLIGFSRIYVCVHYVTDVLAAAVLGCCFALLAKFIVESLYKLAARPGGKKELPLPEEADQTEK